MGAEFNCIRYDTADKKQVAKDWLAAVETCLYENGHCYSGGIGMLGPDIQWRAERFPTAQECERFISDNHEKWEPPMAVAFDGGWVVGGWCAS